jgi:hypothetical protein
MGRIAYFVFNERTEFFIPFISWLGDRVPRTKVKTRAAEVMSPIAQLGRGLRVAAVALSGLI